MNINNIRKISSDLIRILTNVRNIKEIKPLALSANQIGYNSRIFVFICKNTFITIINPTILDYSNESLDQWEICISENYEKNYLINRPKYIRVSYHKFENGVISFVECKTLNEFETRIFLHEIDHLNGVHFAKNNENNDINNSQNNGFSLKRCKSIKEIKFGDSYRNDFINQEILKGRIFVNY